LLGRKLAQNVDFWQEFWQNTFVESKSDFLTFGFGDINLALLEIHSCP